MKKMNTLLSAAAVALTFALFSFGCSGHDGMDSMKTMDDTMPSKSMDKADTMKTHDTKQDMNGSKMDTMKPMDNTMPSKTSDTMKLKESQGPMDNTHQSILNV